MFYAAIVVIALFFIPAFRNMLVNPFRNPMVWVVLAVGALLLYAISFDRKNLRMSNTTRLLMIIGFIAVVIYVMQPGIFSLETQTILSVPEATPRLTSPLTVDYARQIELTEQGLERLAGAQETLFDEIILQRNERLTSGILNVEVKKAESVCDEAGECDFVATTKSVPYEVDIGQFGKDYSGTTADSFDITNQVNAWMDYCGVETCHVPIQVKTTATSFVTLSVGLEKFTIEHTPAELIIEREGVPALQVVGTALFLISILIVIVFFMRRYAPKQWSKIARIFAKIGVR